MGTRVYIGRVSYDVRERDLEKFFKGYGRIREILIKNGFGFVEFDDYRDADDAVSELNGKELLGERVSVEHARGPRRGNGGNRNWRAPPRWRGGQNNKNSYFQLEPKGGGHSAYGPPTRTEYRLIVENLSSRVSWQDLKDYMRQAGEVTYADAHKQRKNEGVVEFATYADMKNALVKLDGTELNGRRVKLMEDKPRKRRSRSRSRSRSGSRSRSPSRSRSRSRSKSRTPSGSRSRSRSPSKSPKSASRSRSKSRSRSPSKSRSKSHSRSRSKSRSASPAKSPAKSKSKSKSKSPSKSPARSGEKSPEPADD